VDATVSCVRFELPRCVLAHVISQPSPVDRRLEQLWRCSGPSSLLLRYQSERSYEARPYCSVERSKSLCSSRYSGLVFPVAHVRTSDSQLGNTSRAWLRCSLHVGHSSWLYHRSGHCEQTRSNFPKGSEEPKCRLELCHCIVHARWTLFGSGTFGKEDVYDSVGSEIDMMHSIPSMLHRPPLIQTSLLAVCSSHHQAVSDNQVPIYSSKAHICSRSSIGMSLF
jgi:hypothetical protein